MSTAAGQFELVRDGDCLIVIPTSDLRESIFEPNNEGTTAILAALDDATARHIVWDFRHTQTFGSTALGFFVKIWRRVCLRRGRMAFCNLTQYEKEILHVTQLNQLWLLCDSLEDAVRLVRE